MSISYTVECIKKLDIALRYCPSRKIYIYSSLQQKVCISYLLLLLLLLLSSSSSSSSLLLRTLMFCERLILTARFLQPCA